MPWVPTKLEPRAPAATTMNLKNVKRIGIIGAGEAGIATAKMLLTSGYDCTVFERNDRIGGVWTDGYLDFGVQVQHELYEFPDFPLPECTPDYTPGETVRRYIQDYADHFGVTPHVRLNTTVTKLSEHESDLSAWVLTYRDSRGITQTEEYDLVVIAVGVYSHTPNIPQFPKQSEFKGTILHNSQMKSVEAIKDRSVAVVGYGKSATDAAVLAAECGKEAAIVFREPHWPVPSVLLGGIPFKYALFNRLTNAMLPPHHHASHQMRLWHRYGKPAIWHFWRLVEKLITIQCGLNRPQRGTSATTANLVPRHPIEYDGFSNSTMLPKPEFFDSIHSGDLGAHQATITSFTQDGLILSDGNTIQCDTVILATGWHTDYGFIPEVFRERIRFEDDGFYLYRQVFHPEVPNLAFIGSNATTYINILTHNLQARWLVELLRGSHELPSPDEMLQEIEAMKKWKRSNIPPSTSRAATLHLHMQHYHDELLQDMSLNPRRKRGLLRAIKEYVAPYEPKDYAEVSSGSEFRSSPSKTESEKRFMNPVRA